MSKKTKFLIWGITGVVVGFTAFWLGAYFLSEIPRDDWRSFPTFMTASIIFGVSAVLGVLGIGAYFEP